MWDSEGMGVDFQSELLGEIGEEMEVGACGCGFWW